MSRMMRNLATVGLILILAGCATAPRVAGGGGSSSNDGRVAASVDIATF